MTIDSPASRQAIASLCFLDTAPDWEAVRQRLPAFLRQFPRAGKIAELRRHHHHWQAAENIDIDYHFPSVHLPNVTNREQLNAALAEEFSRPLDYSRPLWRFILFTAEPENYVVVMFKIHHAFADGVGGLEMVDWWCSAKRVEPIETRSRVTRNEVSVGSRFTLLGLLRQPQGLWHWVRGFFGRTLHGPLNGKNSPQRRIIQCSFPHAEVRMIKKRLGVSSNDVLLGLIAAAVGRYCQKRARPLQELRVVVPVSLRKPSARWSLGNHLSGVPVCLPLCSTGSAKENSGGQHRAIGKPKVTSITEAQVIAVGACMDKLKHTGAFMTYARLANTVAHLPYWLRRFSCEHQARRTSFICTNMPSSVRPRYFFGAEVLSNYVAAALMAGHGIAFGLITYRGQVNILAVYDPEIFEKPELLLQELQEAFAELIV